jgi:predicted O-methyltransferase YrrM
MSWARELGVPTVGPGTGAALRLLAGAAQARTVVEVGTGTGVSGLWLLRGMAPDATLTSIDVEPEHQALARQSFAAAGFEPARYRLIAGPARQILPRLADREYDLVFIDGDAHDHGYGVAAAARLLRTGGVLVVHLAVGEPVDGMEWATEHGVVVDLTASLRNDPQWTVALLPVGAGLLCALRTAVA